MKNLVTLLSLATGALAFMPSQAQAAVHSTVVVEHNHRARHHVWHRHYHRHVVVVHLGNTIAAGTVAVHHVHHLHG